MSKKLTTSEFEARLKQVYGEQFTLLSEYEGRDKQALSVSKYSRSRCH